MKFETCGRHTAAVCILVAVSSVTFMIATPVSAASSGLDQECVMSLAETADDSTTLAEIRSRCKPGCKSQRIRAV